MQNKELQLRQMDTFSVYSAFSEPFRVHNKKKTIQINIKTNYKNLLEIYSTTKKVVIGDS